MELIINSESIPATFPPDHKTPSDSSSATGSDSSVVTLEDVEESHIRRVLEENDYNITISAKKLRIGRNTLYRKIQAYQIDCS